ncbi:hypothetical protein EBZ80_21285 [bacterium]|nr:hypothetical protein [Betaproteobacteria bacterium]NDE17463.1 hypothetical protein [bacterium]
MFRLVLVVLALTMMAGNAQAGPFRRRVTHSYTPSATYQPSAYSHDTSTAQGVAERQAQNCVMGHHGGNSGYEGVGMGSTPDEALGRCCYSRSGMTVVDQGVAQGRDGRWYACKRYR